MSDRMRVRPSFTVLFLAVSAALPALAMAQSSDASSTTASAPPADARTARRARGVHRRRLLGQPRPRWLGLGAGHLRLR